MIDDMKLAIIASFAITMMVVLTSSMRNFSTQLIYRDLQSETVSTQVQVIQKGRGRDRTTHTYLGNNIYSSYKPAGSTITVTDGENIEKVPVGNRHNQYEIGDTLDANRYDYFDENGNYIMSEIKVK